ncbi:MAG: TraR/DksA family transcriptional regulator [Longimicrobiales bacterium]
MKKSELDHLEKRLLKERERVLKALRHLDSSMSPPDADGDLTTYPLHLADEGTDTMEQEQSFLLLSKEGRLLIDIDVALRTLYKEPARFGKCVNCGNEIAFERLDLVPWARFCLECQRLQEERIEPATSGEAA